MSPTRRLLLLAVLVGLAFAAAAGAVPHTPEGLRAAAGAFGPLMPALLLGAWIALTPALFPGTVLAAATGLLLGSAVGFAVGLCGATLGGLVAFALARRFGAEALVRVGGPRLDTLQARLERHGFAAVAGARIAPGVPATALHYVAGLSRVRPGAFAAGILVGGAPRIALYTMLGDKLDDPLSPTFLIAVGAVTVLGVVPLVVAWRRRPQRTG